MAAFKLPDDIAQCQLSVDRCKAFPLISFTNGRVKTNCEGVLECKIYSNAEQQASSLHSSKPLRKLMVVHSPRMQYYSTEFDFWSSQKTAYSRYQVGILKKGSKEMKLYNSQIYECRPSLISSFVEQKLGDSSYIEKVNSLTTAFGSKRKRRAVEARSKNITEEGALKSSLAVAVKRANLTSEFLVPTEDITSLPPQNSAAASPDDVYNLYDVISEDEYKAVEVKAKHFKDASTNDVDLWAADEKYCHYVIQHLKGNIRSINSHKATLLLYYNYLVTLLQLGYKELKRKDPILEIPEPTKSHLLSRFFITTFDDTGRQTRSLPSRQKDKVMAYALVLALFLHNFVVDLAILQRDFKVGAQKLTRIAHTVGCHVSNKKRGGSDVKTVELKIPLFVPNEKSARRRQKDKG